MSVRCPQIALALKGLHAALTAKLGRLTERDRVELLRDVQTFAGDDPAWRKAALDFEALSRRDQIAAGAALLDWLAGPGQVVVPARETASAVREAIDAAVAHGWGARKDCGHG